MTQSITLMSEALDIIVRGREDRPVAFACPKCGTLFILRKNDGEDEMARRRLEASMHCVKTCVCGNPIDKHYMLRCHACITRMEQEKEQARFIKAEKLSLEDYTDAPVYWEGHEGGMGDGYFSGVDEILDYCETEGLEVPEYVWACKPHEFKLDAESILERELENQEMYEDADEDIHEDARGRLQAYLNVWVKEQALVGWQSDYARAILLRKENASMTAQ